MLKNFFCILITTTFAIHTADTQKQKYISELEKQWLILVKENNYAGEVAQEAISLKNQTKETMQKSGLNWQDIDDIELAAIKNAREKNKTSTKAKL
jgi:hypothetical protein